MRSVDKTRIGYGLLLLYVIIAFLLRNTQNFFDEGSNLDLASSVLQGMHLYRDLFDNHFPLAVNISAGVIFFAGKSLPLVRLAVLLIDAAVFFAVLRVSRLYFAVGFAAAVWAFVSPYYFGNMLLYDNLAMISGFALGVVCFAALARGLEASRSMFALLAVAGFAATMSNPFFALVTAIAIGSLFLAPRIPWTFVVKLGVTIAIPIAAYFIYLAATRALGEFYSQAVVFNTTTYQKYAPLAILPTIGTQLALFHIFNPNWLQSFNPWRFNPITYSPVFDHWIFSGLFYRVAAIAACLLFAFRRDYRTAVFLYLFVAMLPLRGDFLFHAAPFVLFCFFLVGVLIEEAASLPRPWKIAALTVCGVPTLVLVISGARYVARHAMQADFDGLTAEANFIRQAAQDRNDVRLAHYPEGNYMYYLTGLRRLSKYGDLQPMVADVGRAEVDADLKRATNLVLVLDIAGNVQGYANNVTLESEIAFAKRRLTKEKFGPVTVYVSPSLAVQANDGAEVGLTALAAPFGAAPTEISGGWSKGGYEQGLGGPGSAPVDGPVFGSFPDANTGTIRLGPFHLDSHAEMAIPLATGPDSRHLSIVVRDAASHQALAKIERPPVRAGWWVWNPQIVLDRALAVEVVAEDKGTDPGQWMALGWPHYLRQRKASRVSKPGLYRAGEWRLLPDIGNLKNPSVRIYHFGGQPDDVPVTGDWDGSGRSKIGVYRASLGQWLLDYNGNGVLDAADKTYQFGGKPGDIPVTGDWDGSGKSKIGIYRPSTGEWLLDYNGDGSFNAAQDRIYQFGGAAGDKPVVGDWTGSGATKIGVVTKDYRWILDSSGDGKFEEKADMTFFFGGIPGDIPVTGEWIGDGRSMPGVFRRDSSWLLDINGNDRHDDPGTNRVVEYGSPGDQPVTGVW